MELSFGVAETKAEELINEGADYDMFGNELFERDAETGVPKDRPSSKKKKIVNNNFDNEYGRRDDEGGDDGTNRPIKKINPKFINRNLNYDNYNEGVYSALTPNANSAPDQPQQQKIEGDADMVNAIFEEEERKMREKMTTRVSDRRVPPDVIKRQIASRQPMKKMRPPQKNIAPQKNKPIEQMLEATRTPPQIVLFNSEDKLAIFAVGILCGIIAYLGFKHCYKKYRNNMIVYDNPKIVKEYTPNKDPDDFIFPSVTFARQPITQGGGGLQESHSFDMPTGESSMPYFVEPLSSFPVPGDFTMNTYYTGGCSAPNIYSSNFL